MNRFIVVVAVLLGLSACTPYGPMGLTGGVEATQVSSDTYAIKAAGNGWLSARRLQEYVLVKAAETTKASGYTHFTFLKNDEKAHTVEWQTTERKKEYAFGTSKEVMWEYDETVNHSSTSYSRDALIRVFSARRGTKLPTDSYNAEDIIQNVKPKIHRLFDWQK